AGAAARPARHLAVNQQDHRLRHARPDRGHRPGGPRGPDERPAGPYLAHRQGADPAPARHLPHPFAGRLPRTLRRDLARPRNAGHRPSQGKRPGSGRNEDRMSMHASQKDQLTVLGGRALVLAVLLAVWAIATLTVVDPFFISSPSRIGAYLGSELTSPGFSYDLYLSGVELGIGYL